jgi:predicted nucleic acid-binding protein
MKRAFADTFYYLALLNPADESHEQLRRLTEGFAGVMVTTDWIVTELADGLCGTANRKIAIEFVDSLRADAAVRIVPASRRLLEKGWRLYRRVDKEWSLTDCISFVVMRELRISDALTADRHFQQVGFNTLFE